MPIKKNIKLKPYNPDDHPFESITLIGYNVKDVYKVCLASEEEIIEGKDLVYAQAFIERFADRETYLSIFTKKKLEKKRQEIEYLLGQIPLSGSMGNFKEFSYDYKNEEWADDFETRVKLFDMGIALKIFTPLMGFEPFPSFHILKEIPKTLSKADISWNKLVELGRKRESSID